MDNLDMYNPIRSSAHAGSGEHAPLTRKSLLTIGFLALTVAVIAAYTTPARGYEVSIYTGTPVLFWIGVGVTMAIALGVSITSLSGRLRGVGVVLGGGGFLAMVGLPIIRNYHYYGTADAMTHLGWAKEIAAGDLRFFELYYPGIHTFAAFISDTIGYPVTRSLMYVVIMVSVLMVVFVALLGWAATGDSLGGVIALFAAALLLPINHIETTMTSKPFSQALLFTALLLYLLWKYVTDDEAAHRGWLHPSAVGVLFALTSVALVLYHGQQALNVLLLLGTVALVQFFLRRAETPAVLGTRPVYAQTGFAGLVFLGWSLQHPRFYSSVSNVSLRLWYVLSGQAVPASNIARQGGALLAIGAGLTEIFLKLFLVSAVFSLLAGVYALANLRDIRQGTRNSRRLFVLYLTAGLVPVTGLFLLYFVGGIDQQFRHQGFIMLLVTVLGALALYEFSGRLPQFGREDASKALLTAAFAVMLVLSVGVFYQSPYIYQHSKQVTEMQMNGYETTFEHEGGHSILGIRTGPDRYHDALRGDLPDVEQLRPVDPAEIERGVTGAHPPPFYLVVTKTDYEREVTAYEEFRYSADHFEMIRSSRDLSRVVSNGEFGLYYAGN